MKRQKPTAVFPCTRRNVKRVKSDSCWRKFAKSPWTGRIVATGVYAFRNISKLPEGNVVVAWRHFLVRHCNRRAWKPPFSVFFGSWIWSAGIWKRKNLSLPLSFQLFDLRLVKKKKKKKKKRKETITKIQDTIFRRSLRGRIGLIRKGKKKNRTSSSYFWFPRKKKILVRELDWPF